MVRAASSEFTKHIYSLNMIKQSVAYCRFSSFTCCFADHKKLPFMAMLRNLRNMIKAGISNKHHQWVLKKLTDWGAVVNSRQFPFRCVVHVLLK